MDIVVRCRPYRVGFFARNRTLRNRPKVGYESHSVLYGLRSKDLERQARRA